VLGIVVSVPQAVEVGVQVGNDLFAGHVNAIVLETALGRLDAVYQSGTAPAGLRVTLVDGTLGTFPLL